MCLHLKLLSVGVQVACRPRPKDGCCCGCACVFCMCMMLHVESRCYNGTAPWWHGAPHASILVARCFRLRSCAKRCRQCCCARTHLIGAEVAPWTCSTLCSNAHKRSFATCKMKTPHIANASSFTEPSSVCFGSSFCSVAYLYSTYRCFGNRVCAPVRLQSSVCRHAHSCVSA